MGEEIKIVITETEIIARKIQLEEQYQSARSMMDALGGAIQDCEWWMKKIADKEQAAKAEEEAAAKKRKKK